LWKSILLQCRLRGKIDSNGVVAAYLEERLNMGVNFLLSAEVSMGYNQFQEGFFSPFHSLNEQELNTLRFIGIFYRHCNFTLQIDHCKKNYKFGFGMTVGE